jgi:16S rRNA (cytosine967-C5)-methyltransferase
MRLGGRLAAAMEVLDDIAQRKRPAADALKDWGLSHRFAGSGDRGAIGNIVYDALRRKRSAGWLFDADTSRAQAFGALLLEWKETPEALNGVLEGDRFAPALLTDDEIHLATSRRLEEAPAEVQADLPGWCVPFFKDAFGDDWVAEAAALSARPPLDLRVNTLKAKRDSVLTELSGVGAASTALAAGGIRIPPIDGSGRHPNVQAEPGFQKGWFEVQDEGSQVVAALAGAAPGMQVLDYCAGAGGKTLALSAAMENKGQIFAYDSYKARLAPIFDRLKRAESRNVQVVSKPLELEALEGRMDLVLVDAPCTGSGTWRRRPDAKWRLSEKQLGTRTGEQKAILDAAKAYVKPGGHLVYITCSVFPAENAGQVDAFLAREPAFTALDHESLWSGRFADRADAARIDKPRGVSLTPARSGTDGFFFSALARTG